MTKEQFRNLKVGDIVKYEYKGKYTIEEVVDIDTHNFKEFKIIDNGNSKFEIGRRYWTSIDFIDTYKLYNIKPKKLYKPWG